jgi:ankyrin repeat protein
MQVTKLGRAVLALVGVAALVAPAELRLGAASAGLVEAVRDGDRAAIQVALVAAKDIDDGGIDGTTALHWAAKRGDAETVAALLKRGALPDVANRYGVTPLRVAAEEGSVVVVEALLKAGADAGAVRKESGDTPLMMAARSGHAAVVRALIAKGAVVDVVEPRRNQTALMWAAAEHHPDVVKVLLEAGANTQALSITKISPLMFAIRAGDIESTRILLDTGIDVKEPASDGTHMLTLAMVNAHYELAKFLLERGAASRCIFWPSCTRPTTGPCRRCCHDNSHRPASRPTRWPMHCLSGAPTSMLDLLVGLRQS